MTRKDLRRARRVARADADRRRALSPIRILFKVAVLPVVAGGIAVSLFVRTSDFTPGDAVLHLFALAGCDAAAAVGLAPAREGEPGYHPRNDPDGDGLACPSDKAPRATASSAAPMRAPDADVTRTATGGAKFIRP